MKTVAIIAKPHGDRVKQVTREVVDFLKGRGMDILLDERAAEVFQRSEYNSDEEIRSKADLIVVLGGDGTMISAVRILGNTEKPIFGINLGRVGFITETKVEEATVELERILNGDYTCESRMKLTCIKERNGKQMETMEILNDFVLNKGALARVIEMEVFIDGIFVNSYRADGLIIATPTGSTAYSLAAGGPIIHPSLESIIITPICPHSLTNRPILAPSNSVVRVKLKTDYEKVFVTYDGQIGKRVSVADEYVIKRSESSAQIILSSHRNYFGLLREKLGWGAQ